MKLQTVVNINTAPFLIEKSSRVLVVGSCFAENIGGKLSKVEGVEVYNNPCGVVYNPLSVERAVEIFKRGEKFSEQDLLHRDGLWHSMDFHGSFSGVDKDAVLKGINREAVDNVDIVIVTLGSAYVYFRDGRVVANCHKFPEKEFSRRRISVEESLLALKKIAGAYPTAKFIVTLSPIRHLRDGLSENFVSKATLRVAIEEFCREDSGSRVYFPAYEILMDELRDYRFTAEDMCHPTPQTATYIWERFSEQYLTKEYREAVLEALKRERHNAHRPLR